MAGKIAAAEQKSEMVNLPRKASFLRGLRVQGFGVLRWFQGLEFRVYGLGWYCMLFLTGNAGNPLRKRGFGAAF